VIAAVTGANGYVGSRICRRLAAMGCEVVALARTAPPESTHVPWSLNDEVSPQLFRSLKIDALVHCAYDFSPMHWNEIRRINVEGSVRLLEAAQAAGVRQIVFISTISAFPGCKSLYGAAKMETEKVAHRLGGTVIRPGLVWGENSGGMFGALRQRAQTASIVPLIGSGNHLQYLVHEEDLGDLIARCVSGEVNATGAITAAAEQPWRLRDLIATIAGRSRRKPSFLPVPWRAAWAALKVAETAGLKLGFRSDSIVSLVYQNPEPDFSEARRLGLRFRPFA
jgi:nucleoside-diphosphate-sugar epimerase